MPQREGRLCWWFWLSSSQSVILVTTADHQSQDGLFSAPIQFSQSEATFSVLLTCEPAASNCEIIECEPSSSSTEKDPSLEIKTLFDSQQHWPAVLVCVSLLTPECNWIWQLGDVRIPGPGRSSASTRAMSRQICSGWQHCLMSGTAASCRLRTLQCCRHCDPSSPACVMTWSLTSGSGAGYGYTLYSSHSALHSSLVHNIASLQRNQIVFAIKSHCQFPSHLQLDLNWYFNCCLRFIDNNYAFQIIVWSIICHYH